MINHPLYPNGRVYLSGGMQHADGLGSQWRKICADNLRRMKYYPIDITHLDRTYAKKYGELYFMEDKDNHLQYKSNFRQHFIHADIELVRNDSDALIVYYDESVRRGAGTTSEIHEAYQHDIPVFLISAYENWMAEVPGWMQAETTRIFTEWTDLYKYLQQLPPGILRRDRYGNHGINNQYLCSLCGAVFEKTKHHFVSKVTPTYCNSCVDLITRTHEGHVDRYEFIQEVLEEERDSEVRELERRQTKRIEKSKYDKYGEHLDFPDMHDMWRRKVNDR